MALEYFNAYFSYLDSMEELKDAERGRLFTACLLYSKTGEVMELSGNERYVFPTMRSQIDRDKAAYAEKCNKNRLNGSKSTERTVPNAPERPRTPPKEKEKEKEKDIYPPISPKGFDEWWRVYPKKVGKEAAKKAFEKIKVPTEELIAAVEKQKKSEQWKKDGGQYIPNPTTWLNQGRWEDELTSDEKEDLYSMAFRRNLLKRGVQNE